MFLKMWNEPRYKKSLKDRQMLPVWGHMKVILEAVKEHQWWCSVVTLTEERVLRFVSSCSMFGLLNWDTANRRHVEIIFTQPQQLSAIGVVESVGEEQAEKSGNTVTRYDWRARYQLGCCSL
jgi:HrpA-like RNA helicase